MWIIPFENFSRLRCKTSCIEKYNVVTVTHSKSNKYDFLCIFYGEKKKNMLKYINLYV